MPAIVDEQVRVREALDEERLRREEATRVMAEQDALAMLAQQQAIAAQATFPPIPQGGNYMNQRQGEIDAIQAQFNQQAQPTAFVPAPTRTIDSQEYLDEVASAQRNSGFINATVGPGGNVISPGYDPSTDLRALKAQQEATNLQRNQYVDSLIKGGATYPEAYRAGQGRYPQAKNDAMRLRVEQLAQKQNIPALMQPEVTTIDGVRVMRTGPNSFSRILEPRTASAPKTVMPPDTEASQKILTGQITEARKDLQRAKTAAEKDPEDIGAVRRARLYQEQLQALEKQLQVGSTNWMSAPQASPAPIPVAPTAATPAQAKTVIKYDKSGKAWIVDPETKKVIGPA